jgi:HEAT repeat protein
MMLLKPDVNDLVNREDTRGLIRATKHWSAPIRADAATALGAFRTASAVPELIRLLKDGETEVREAAARALGDIGRTEAVGPLVDALRAIAIVRNDRPGSKEYEFEAMAEALGRLNHPQGVAAVIESGTVRFHEGFFSVSRPHVGGLCLSGSTEARAALLRIMAEHHLYETYSLIGVVEALDYLHEPRIGAALMEILSACVELLKKPVSDPSEGRTRNVAALALASARALGRLETKRAEPLLMDLLVRLPVHAFPGGAEDGAAAPQVSQSFIDTQNAILAIREERRPAEFDCGRSFLRLRDYQTRRYKTDVEFGGQRRRSMQTATAAGY